MLNGKFWKYFCIVFISLEFIVLSLHIFSEGFLLKRDAFTNKSKCCDFKFSCLKNVDPCLLPKKFDKAILLIIDAFRYDFVNYNEKLKDKHYLNKIKVINDLLRNEPRNSKLFKFIADPPTTTMQRLKGLTTGSLPTFIDASHNFASSEISEDNLIDQLKLSAKRIIALGDDTWEDLYPNRFFKSFLFPSFNVMDLDTVDNGILNHIYDEIKNKEWDFMIAHFLGVDHCGHRYGPSHPQMGVKLKQMDQVIKNVSDLITEDTLLVVVGDHGMTSTGDHGGDSTDEIETVLFFYSPGFDLPVKNSNSLLSISQIDIVPTLASLLGIPIPFSNLGKIVEDVLQFDNSTSCSYLDALYMNYQQVNKYLDIYQEVKNEFPDSVWTELKTISIAVEKEDKTKEKERKIINFLNLAKTMCEEIWAKFNVTNIIIGLFWYTFALIIFSIILPKNKSESILFHFKYIIILFLIVNTIYGISLLVSDMRLNVLTCFVLLLFCIIFIEARLPLGWNALSFLVLLLISMGSFSNSFVVMEDTATVFMLISFNIVQVCKVFHKKLKKKVRCKRFLSLFTACDFLLLFCLFSIIICLRMSRFFLKCREEQYWCDSSSFVHVSLSGLPNEFQNARYFTSLIPLIALVLAPQTWLRRCGNLNGYEINVVIAKGFPILSGLLISGYWALQSVPSIPGNIAKIAVHLPQLIYLILFLGILLVCYNPLFVYILPPSNSVVETAGTPVIPQLFMKLKERYDNKNFLKARKTPIVYGLATSISAPLVILVSLLSFSIVVISGDGMAPGVILLISVGVLALIFQSFIFWYQASQVETLLMPNWNSIVMWFLISAYGFYATGHQATFPSLNWSAAFVGYDGTGSHLLPALLVTINTFSSHLLFGISLPLLQIIPFSLSFLWPPLKREKDFGEAGTRGEFLLVERLEEAKETFSNMAIIYAFLHTFKVFLSTVAAFILRRHLMVWKIFAPHFIFEAVGLGVTYFAVLAGLLFVFRVLSALEAWSKKL